MDNELQFEKIEKKTHTSYLAKSELGIFAIVCHQDGTVDYNSYWEDDFHGFGLESFEEVMSICQDHYQKLLKEKEDKKHTIHPGIFQPQYDPIIVELGTNQFGQCGDCDLLSVHGCDYEECQLKLDNGSKPSEKCPMFETIGITKKMSLMLQEIGEREENE